MWRSIKCNLMAIRRQQNQVPRYRRFVFTLNNYTEQEYIDLTTRLAPTVKWIVIGKERAPETGTPHLQGACVLGFQKTLTALKNSPGLSRAHIQQMYGQPQHSLAYCTKEDTEAFQMGVIPEPGKRTDLSVAVERIGEGMTLQQLADSDETGQICIVKYFKGLTVLRSLTRPERSGAPRTFWLYGSTGVGKTRCSVELCKLLVANEDPWMSSGSLRWFDGYDGQKAVIFDDFRAKHVNSFSFLLRILDRYPVRVEFKGGFVNWTPEYIFITCNKDPDECFSTRKQHVPEDIAQLRRRLTDIIEIESELTDASRSALVADILGQCGASIATELPTVSSDSPGDGGGEL